MQQYTTEQRVKIIQTYYENGRSNVRTFRALREYFGIQNRPSRQAITNVVQKFERNGSVLNIKTPQRVRPVRSEENVANIRESVAQEPKTSIRRRSQQLGLRYTSTQRILAKDLNLHPYKVQITQELKPRDHLQRRMFCEWMLQHEVDFSRKIIFSDEAHFNLNGFVNKQNCRVWGLQNPREVVEKQIFPKKVTVWCGLWAEGVIGPYFFENHEENAVTVNAVRYRSMITDFLWQELEGVDIEEVWFQQDGATCHTTRETIDLLQTRFPGRVISRNGDINWPPRSCDLTPLDFFLWGYLKNKVYVNMPNTIPELKQEIRREIAAIEPALCRRVVENFDQRIRFCHLSRGGHMADVIFHT